MFSVGDMVRLELPESNFYYETLKQFIGVDLMIRKVEQGFDGPCYYLMDMPSNFAWTNKYLVPSPVRIDEPVFESSDLLCLLGGE